MVGNVVSALYALSKSVFKSTLNVLINEKYYIHKYIDVDIERHQSLLVCAISKVDFSISPDICVVPNKLKFNAGKTKVYQNEILISSTDIKTSSN